MWFLLGWHSGHDLLLGNTATSFVDVWPHCSSADQHPDAVAKAFALLAKLAGASPSTPSSFRNSQMPTAVSFNSLLDVPSRIGYGVWRLLGGRYPVRLRLRSGLVFLLRRRPHSDWDTAYEIFRERIYAIPAPVETTRSIVDLGGNIGLSCLFWAQEFPRAQIQVFEPLPEHRDLLLKHVAANGLEKRVTLVEAAADTSYGTLTFVADGVRSRSSHSDPEAVINNHVSVPQVDFFREVADGRIDILKIDIEGGEYAILADERFLTFAQRVLRVVLEVHTRESTHLGLQWCINRLRSAGFTRIEAQSSGAGTDLAMIIAERSDTPAS